MMRILAIGNSFSQDATYYLHSILEAEGIENQVVNLYIGGCSLERHWKNVREDNAEYVYELNGSSTKRMVSIREALEEERWDYVITQQASHDSGWFDTYEPFLSGMIGYMREKAPDAEVLLHKTWAYEKDSNHDAFPRYRCDQKEMYERLSFAYGEAAKKEGVRLIPGGDVIQRLRQISPFVYEAGGISLCRDGFHMHFLYGRYALAAAWYDTLTGKNIRDNGFIPSSPLCEGETADSEALAVIREQVDAVCHPC